MVKDKKPKHDPHFLELCKATYIEELDKANGYLEIGGLPVQERCIEAYMEWRKCDRKRAEAYFDECALFYSIYLERTLRVINAREEPIAKKLPEKYDLDPEYIYHLAADVFEDRLGGRKVFIKSHMAKNKSTKERAEKRFMDYAQHYAPVLRSVLKALIQFGEVPKKAIKARVK
jgi:hypothetical protein